MTGKVHIVERGDAFTAREIKDLTESRAFNVYRARIDQMIEDQRKACENADGLKDLRRAQGALKALQTVKLLPKILIGELEKK